MILFHNWRPPLVGSETGGFGIMKPDGTPTERWQAIKEVIAEVKSQKLKVKINEYAIYYSKTSEIQTFQEEGHYRPCSPQWFSGRGDFGLFFASNAVAGAYRLLWDKKVPAKFIFDQQLKTGKIDCKVLLLTNPYLLSRKQFDHLVDFMKKGGTVLSEARLGSKDQNGHLYQHPLLEELLGEKHLYTRILDGAETVKKLGLPIHGFSDVLEKHIFPAIITKTIGKGRLIFSTFNLFGSLVKLDHKKVGRIRNALRIF
jgi:hypothetical protein